MDQIQKLRRSVFPSRASQSGLDPSVLHRPEQLRWDTCMKLHDVFSTGQMLQKYAGLSSNEHGDHTPGRFLSMLDELTMCKDCAGDCIKWKDFEAESQDMVVIQNIPFSSLCNHHVVPFTGYATIGYVPRRRVAGLSKFARVVHHFARQLQVQEKLTHMVENYIQTRLDPLGVAVVLKAEHMCMTIRGVQAPGTYTSTARMTGVFNDHERTAKAEFLTYLNGQK